MTDVTGLRFTRVWAMPNSETFSILPIEMMVKRYLLYSKCSIDPFAKNSRLATYTNDINPDTTADQHMDAGDFLDWMQGCLVKPDLALFDPPYSPRQISECYKSFGKKVTTEDTQNAALYSRVRKILKCMVVEGGVVLSFGWNSAGMGKGWKIEEIMLVCHGGAHNDTICMAERKL